MHTTIDIKAHTFVINVIQSTRRGTQLPGRCLTTICEKRRKLGPRHWKIFVCNTNPVCSVSGIRPVISLEANPDHIITINTYDAYLWVDLWLYVISYRLADIPECLICYNLTDRYAIITHAKV